MVFCIVCKFFLQKRVKGISNAEPQIRHRIRPQTRGDQSADTNAVAAYSSKQISTNRTKFMQTG